MEIPEDPAVYTGETWEQTCRRLASLAIPESDQPSEEQLAALDPVDSVHHYYGIDTERDYTKARHAAVRELSEQVPVQFGGSTVLMMLYANGFGVKRYLPLAIHFACLEQGALTEVRGRVERLRSTKTFVDAEPFDVCQDAESGLLLGACEALSVARKRPTVQARIASLTGSWPDDQKQALREVMGAAQAFWKAHAYHEQDLPGLDAEGTRATLELQLLQEFSELLAQFAAGAVPPDSSDMKALSAELRRQYAKLLRARRAAHAVSAADLRIAQRAWETYREAWSALARIRYPAASKAIWDGPLYAQRLRQLRALEEYESLQ